MYKKIILIISNSYDIHVDVLEEKVKKLNGETFRINIDEYPKNFTLTLDASGIGVIKNNINNQTIMSYDIGAVWLRKKGELSFIHEELSAQEKQFASNESQHILRSLLFSLDCYWMNHPNALNQARWKVEQSKRASEMGFLVPDSIITNSPDDVLAFKLKHENGIITKPMSGSLLGSDEVGEDEIEVHMMSTTLVTEEMMDYIDGVSVFPTYFQEYIDKRYEVRVTVMGDNVFAARINSQDSELTKIDSRSMSAEIEYAYYELPEDILNRCVRFVKSYGLEYGAIDLIVDLQGNYVFLENNPVGQFLYVEQLVPELKMMDYLAEKLVKETTC